MVTYGSLDALIAARAALALVKIELASAGPERREWFTALAAELMAVVADAQKQRFVKGAV